MTGRANNSLSEHEAVADPSAYRSHVALVAMDVVLALCALGAIAALVLVHGFRAVPVDAIELPWGTVELAGLVRVGQVVIATLFVLDRVLRLALARRPLTHLRASWIDFAVMAMGAVAAVSFRHMRADVFSAAMLYVAISGLYVIVTGGVRVAGLRRRFGESPLAVLCVMVVTLGVVWAAGAGLLMLPMAKPVTEVKAMTSEDAFFTATSAICATGLSTIDLGQELSLFGQTVVLVLMQAGGMVMMLFGTILVVVVGRRLSKGQGGTEQMRDALVPPGLHDLRKVAIMVVGVTLVFEAIGAILLYPMFAAPDARGRMMPTGLALWQSIFHSVSAFCNAGLSLSPQSLAPFRRQWQLMGVIMPLLVLGGLGFPVLHEVFSYLSRQVRGLIWGRPQGAQVPPLSLHSKIVLTTTFLLILGGASVFMLVEKGNVPSDKQDTEQLGRSWTQWQRMGYWDRLPLAFFHSASARSGGFSAIDVNELKDPGRMVLMGLMAVGGSPGGCAGGMRTTTLAVLVLVIFAALTRRKAEAFGRSIAVEVVQRAITVASIYLLLVGVVALVLCNGSDRPDRNFMGVLFESFSACGNVGLSCGVTKDLNTLGRADLIAGMFLGRLTPLALVVLMAGRLRPAKCEHPQEHLAIG